METPSRSAEPTEGSAATTLSNARQLELAGHMDAAADAYIQAVKETEGSGRPGILCEALRRLAILEHRRNRPALAEELCQRSYDAAVALGDRSLAGEALSTLGEFEVDQGSVASAQLNYQNALALAGESVELRARLERNFGGVRSIQGDNDAALACYRSSLVAFLSAGDDAGVATIRRDIGVLNIRMGELDAAARELAQSGAIAHQLDDVHLKAQSDLGTAELFHACRQFDGATERANAALAVFEATDSRINQSAAHRMIGMILRDTNQAVRAGERLHIALALAIETGWILGQADALRELGLLEASAGRAERAGTLFRTGLDLYSQLQAWSRVAELTERLASLAP